MEDFLLHTFPIVAIEALAALTGIYFIWKQEVNFPTKFFIYFLGLTVLVEILGAYSPIAYFTDYAYFGFVKNTFIERNFWLYNIHTIISYFIYTNFFKWHLKSRSQRKIVNVLLGLFVFVCIVNLCLSDIFFTGFSALTEISGSILALFTIALYYQQLLTSDDILNFKRSLPFYISLGAMLLYFVLTPLFIYSSFFDTEESPEFVKFYKTLLVSTNVLVYLIYTFGFIICLRKRDY